MKTIGTWLAGIIVAVIVLGVFALCGKFAEEDRAKQQTQTNETHRGKSVILPYMANPVHSWHPANVNHVHHR
jgi:hypothetical protein